MAWVKAEYAGELAVVSAWVAALTPWSLTFQPDGPLGSILFMARFSLLELQVRVPATVTFDGRPVPAAEVARILALEYPGTRLLGGAYLTNPFGAMAFYDRRALVLGSAAWAAGALVVVLALALSVWLYRDEADARERLPVDAVRTMGGLLALATVLFALAAAGYYRGSDLVGVPVPVGVVVVGALAVALLRVERV